jgi:hypothetical protein
MRIPAMFLGAALLFAQTPGWSQPAADDSGAKQDVKTAGKDTKKAAVATGKDVKKGTTKTVHATKKVFHKTKTTTEGAVNGGKDGAKQ